MQWLRQDLAPLKHHTDVLALGVLDWILVVFDVARLSGVDCVIATHCAIVTSEPMRASLSKDDISGNDILLCDVAAKVRLTQKTGNLAIL